MVLTKSTMMALDTQAPDFTLTDVTTGNDVTLSTHAANAPVLLMFICCHCPYVKHIEEGLATLGKDYQKSKLAIIAISSNDAKNYPDDSPKRLKAMAKRLDLTFPYCHDDTQTVAQSFTASCTPDFFLFDANHQLVYRGQFDNSRPNSGVPVTGKDLRAAIDAVLNQQPVQETQHPSIGCNIKWIPGNEPNY